MRKCCEYEKELKTLRNQSIHYKLINIITYIVRTPKKPNVACPNAKYHIRQKTIWLVDNVLFIYFVCVVQIQKAEYC
jgi:hypothetical protein